MKIVRAQACAGLRGSGRPGGQCALRSWPRGTVEHRPDHLARSAAPSGGWPRGETSPRLAMLTLPLWW